MPCSIQTKASAPLKQHGMYTCTTAIRASSGEKAEANGLVKRHIMVQTNNKTAQKPITL